MVVIALGVWNVRTLPGLIDVPLTDVPPWIRWRIDVQGLGVPAALAAFGLIAAALNGACLLERTRSWPERVTHGLAVVFALSCAWWGVRAAVTYVGFFGDYSG